MSTSELKALNKLGSVPTREWSGRVCVASLAWSEKLVERCTAARPPHSSVWAGEQLQAYGAEAADDFCVINQARSRPMGGAGRQGRDCPYFPKTAAAGRDIADIADTAQRVRRAEGRGAGRGRR